jgi:acetyl-CoA carboxylase biotin carboxyl carrier protein
MVNKKLQALLDFAEKTDLQEVLWETEGTLVTFQRRAAPVREAPLRTASHGAAAPAPTAKAPEPVVIRSTMVGTFYRSDSSDRPPFVVEGTVVANGQPVAAIEAMKIMKDVLAPSDCRIVKALVENGHPVEYGQPLFEVTPEKSNV